MIKHLYLEDSTLKEFKAELDEVHGTSAPVMREGVVLIVI